MILGDSGYEVRLRRSRSEKGEENKLEENKTKNST